MSFFNKGFQALGGASAPSFFNKVAGGARSLFNKAPQALRSFSSGLGQASGARQRGEHQQPSVERPANFGFGEADWRWWRIGNRSWRGGQRRAGVVASQPCLQSKQPRYGGQRRFVGD